MSALRVLFIGGTGTISSACAALAVERGIELTVLNRGTTTLRPLPEQTEVIQADIRDASATGAALQARSFDVVVDFVAFTPEHVRQDIELFEGRTGQYVFISSASAYQTPPVRLPIVESTPLRNPEWEYSRNKIAGEDLLVAAYRDRGFPATIVRPSHTYARTSVPLIGGTTALHRLLQGKPLVVPGDGTSLWVLTHHRDFAQAFVGLLGHPQAIGDSFHITSDEVLTWSQIYQAVGTAAGTEPRLTPVASRTIAHEIPALGPGLLGDKTHSVIFDNSKVKAVVPEYTATIPFATGAREIVDWHAEHPHLLSVDGEVDAAFDRLAAPPL